MALRQYIEVIRDHARKDFKRARDAWPLQLLRSRLVPNVIEAIGAPRQLGLLWRSTCVTFVGENGVDEGGLSADMHASFWRDVLRPEHGLFRQLSEGGAHLLRPDADPERLTAVGRMLLKSVLDDHPLGHGIGRFTFEYLSGSHEWRAFRKECPNPRYALHLLSDADPELARGWSQLLDKSAEELAAFELTMDAFDDSLADVKVTHSNIAQAVVAGCRRKLLVEQQAALEALREGFTFGGRIDLAMQLAQHPADDLQLLLQGKPTMSAQDILDCFDWSEPYSSPAVGYLRELLGSSTGDIDESRRFQLLRWCTGRNTLPINGLGRKVVLLLDETEHGGPADARFPRPHTCSYELELPPYSSVAVLGKQLCHALDEFELDSSFGEQ